jgi:PilZ domain
MRLLATADVWVYWECNRLRDVSHVRDLSMAGLFIETRRSRPKGDLVHVHFLVAEGQVRLDGIVVRCQPNGLGLKFQSVTKEDIPQLTDLIDRMRCTSLFAPVSCRPFDFFS